MPEYAGEAAGGRFSVSAFFVCISEQDFGISPACGRSRSAQCDRDVGVSFTGTT